MKKLAQLSNPILYGLVFFFFLVVYFLAIKPTLALYGELKELRTFQASGVANQTPKGSLKELQKLEELLAKLQPLQNVQTTVLGALGNRSLTLQSFREEKIGEKEFSGEKGIRKYVLKVSGTYKELLALAQVLNQLAISSSSIAVNEEQQEILSLNIIVNKN
jgi:hypothetical protein